MSRSREQINDRVINELLIKIRTQINAYDKKATFNPELDDDAFQNFYLILNALDNYRFQIKKQKPALNVVLKKLLVNELRKGGYYGDIKSALRKLFNATCFTSDAHQQFCEHWQLGPEDRIKDFPLWHKFLKEFREYCDDQGLRIYLDDNITFNTPFVNLSRDLAKENQGAKKELKIFTMQNLARICLEYVSAEKDSDLAFALGKFLHDKFLQKLVEREILKDVYENHNVTYSEALSKQVLENYLLTLNRRYIQKVERAEEARPELKVPDRKKKKNKKSEAVSKKLSLMNICLRFINSTYWTEQHKRMKVKNDRGECPQHIENMRLDTKNRLSEDTLKILKEEAVKAKSQNPDFYMLFRFLSITPTRTKSTNKFYYYLSQMDLNSPQSIARTLDTITNFISERKYFKKDLEKQKELSEIINGPTDDLILESSSVNHADMSNAKKPNEDVSTSKSEESDKHIDNELKYIDVIFNSQWNEFDTYLHSNENYKKYWKDNHKFITDCADYIMHRLVAAKLCNQSPNNMSSEEISTLDSVRNNEKLTEKNIQIIRQILAKDKKLTKEIACELKKLVVKRLKSNPTPIHFFSAFNSADRSSLRNYDAIFRGFLAGFEKFTDTGLQYAARLKPKPTPTSYSNNVIKKSNGCRSMSTTL